MAPWDLMNRGCGSGADVLIDGEAVVVPLDAAVGVVAVAGDDNEDRAIV